jgi:dihydrofolate reductase
MGFTMAKLIYSAITSLDGYIADEHGNFDWAAPDEEVHAFVNDLERPVGTYLYGRRMYEVMVAWETAHTFADQRPAMQDFAKLWQAADKVVYSRMLSAVSSARTRIERDFDPEAVRQLKRQRDVTSAWAVPTSPPRRSGRGWSTSTTCSWCPSWWEAATSPSPTASAGGSSCWTNAGSRAAWFTSATAPGREKTVTLSGRHGLGHRSPVAWAGPPRRCPM